MQFPSSDLNRFNAPPWCRYSSFSPPRNSFGPTRVLIDPRVPTAIRILIFSPPQLRHVGQHSFFLFGRFFSPRLAETNLPLLLWQQAKHPTLPAPSPRSPCSPLSFPPSLMTRGSPFPAGAVLGFFFPPSRPGTAFSSRRQTLLFPPIGLQLYCADNSPLFSNAYPPI